MSVVLHFIVRLRFQLCGMLRGFCFLKLAASYKEE